VRANVQSYTVECGWDTLMTTIADPNNQTDESWGIAVAPRPVDRRRTLSCGALVCDGREAFPRRRRSARRLDLRRRESGPLATHRGAVPADEWSPAPSRWRASAWPSARGEAASIQGRPASARDEEAAVWWADGRTGRISSRTTWTRRAVVEPRIAMRSQFLCMHT
jgi:hypothetical protein